MIGAAAAVAAVRAALRAGDMPAAKRQAIALHAAHQGDDVVGFVAAVLAAAGDYTGARGLLRALPETPDRLLLRLTCATKLHMLQEARDFAGRLLARNPADLDAQRWLAEAEGVTIKRKPGWDHPADRALRAGDLKNGFRYMARFLDAQQAPERRIGPPVPRWRGERIEHLVVSNAMGDGDTLQFARYLPAAAERVGRLTIAARPPLLGLLRANGFECCGLYGITAALDGADAQIEAMVLPTAIGTSYGRTAAYLRAGMPHDFGPGFHVGVCWTSSEGTDRTVPVAMLEPLAAVPGVVFHCLTFGPRAADAPLWVQPLDVGDYEQTARLMAGLDLVITVDSSPAHLAGALGVPVWVALPGARADWRFERHPTAWPWYESARLFRGHAAFGNMAGELRTQSVEWRTRRCCHSSP